MRASFADLDLTQNSFETSRDALNRGRAAIDEILTQLVCPTVVFTHGKLLTLILGSYSAEFGYEDWCKMSNPDVFELKLEGESASVSRVWR